MALTLPFVALLSLILYPLYKHLYFGLALVVIAGLIAFMPGVPGHRWRVPLTSDRQWLTGLTILGLLARVPLILFAPRPESDLRIYFQTAQRIAAGAGFGSYVFYPPGQAAFLSLWIRLFGSNIHVLAAIECLVSLATISITFAGFARYSHSAARWASATVALYPSIVIWSGTLGHETLVMLFSAIIFWLLGKASESMKIGWWVLCGATTGLVSLVRPTYVVAPLLMFACLWLSRHSLRRSLLAGMVIMLSCLAVIAPWTWRNYQRFHHFALISTNFGITMLSSNHPRSDGIWMETMDIGKDLDPVRQDKLQLKLALDSISAQPGVFIRRTFKRIAYMWGADTSIPDAAFNSEANSSSKIRLALRVLVQVFWTAFVVAWCISAFKLKPGLGVKEAPVWAILWATFLFCIHAVLEPAARHHMALLPMLAGVYLPSYGDWVTGGKSSVLP